MFTFFHPALAFVVYLLVGGGLLGLGWFLAGPARRPAPPASVYASGEAAPTTAGVPGYRPYFKLALFFALLHLGVLVLATSVGQPLTLVYMVGLGLVLSVMLSE